MPLPWDTIEIDWERGRVLPTQALRCSLNSPCPLVHVCTSGSLSPSLSILMLLCQCLRDTQLLPLRCYCLLAYYHIKPKFCMPILASTLLFLRSPNACPLTHTSSVDALNVHILASHAWYIFMDERPPSHHCPLPPGATALSYSYLLCHRPLLPTTDSDLKPTEREERELAHHCQCLLLVLLGT